MNRKNKGFTLAELLIVVAIIAVLAGISIPVFMIKLEKSREAVDAANIRGAYAVVRMGSSLEMSKAEFEAKSGQGFVYTFDGNTYQGKVALCQKTNGWESDITEIGGISINEHETDTTHYAVVKNVAGETTATITYEN